jgi:hypothetical protein
VSQHTKYIPGLLKHFVSVAVESPAFSLSSSWLAGYSQFGAVQDPATLLIGGTRFLDILQTTMLGTVLARKGPLFYSHVHK